MSCKARQYNDQMLCDHCGVQWDVNDPEPFDCPEENPILSGDNVSLGDIREMLNTPGVAPDITKNDVMEMFENFVEDYTGHHIHADKIVQGSDNHMLLVSFVVGFGAGNSAGLLGCKLKSEE